MSERSIERRLEDRETRAGHDRDDLPPWRELVESRDPEVTASTPLVEAWTAYLSLADPDSDAREGGDE